MSDKIYAIPLGGDEAGEDLEGVAKDIGGGNYAPVVAMDEESRNALLNISAKLDLFATLISNGRWKILSI